MHKLHRHIKRHYKKIACALAGAACLSALVHTAPTAGTLPTPTAKPLATAKPPPPVTGQAVPPAEKGGPQTAPITEQLVTKVKEAMPAPRANTETSAGNEGVPLPDPVTKPENKAPEQSAEKVLDMTATAYAPGPQDNDQWGTKTHLGTEVRPGIIAVDPRVIPLGSRVMIKYPDGRKEYAVAEDTGGAIKGPRIDVAKWTVGEAKQFGIKAVKVYVLETPAAKKSVGG